MRTAPNPVRAEPLERRVMFTAALPDLVGGEFQVNTATANRQRIPATAMDHDGDFVIVWQSEGQDGSGFGIYGQRYGAAGAPLGGEFRVNTYTTGHQQDAAVAMDTDGNFVVTWWGEGAGDAIGIFARRFDAAGAPIGNEFHVNSGAGANQVLPDVGMADDGQFVIAWGSDGQDGSEYGVYARRYAATGAAQGGEFRINTFTTRNQLEPAVAVDADGDFVIAWTSIGQDIPQSISFGVYAQRYNAAGAPVGGEFRVNTFTTHNQYFPDVDADDAGNFVVAWISDNQDGSLGGIYAQRYAASGAPQGGEFRVNVTTSGGQYVPKVAMDADGDFVISWHGDIQDGDGDGTAARRYNAVGLPLTGELRPNLFTTHDQFATAVASDDAGNFVIAWTSTGPDGSLDGVFARHFDISAPAVTSAAFHVEPWPQRIEYTFDQDVGPSLSSTDVVVRNLTTGHIIPPVHFSLSYDAATNEATLSYTGSGGTAILADGRYRATLTATGVIGPLGQAMAQDHVLEFFFLNGDATRDGRVNLDDFNVLASNFGQSNRTFTQGDFTYDGIVSLNDFDVLASRFGVAVSPAASASAGARGSDELPDDVVGKLLA